MDTTFQKVIIEPVKRFYTIVLDFLPNLLTSLLILGLGILIAVAMRKMFTRLFTAINLDKLSEKAGFSEILQKGGIKEPVSQLFSRIIGWLIILTFLIVSLNALKVPTIERLLAELFLYLPNVFLALLILLAGYLLSNFLGRTALIASVNAGFKLSGMIGKFVKFTVFFFSITMALEQLGIGKESVLIAFTIIYAGVVFAFAIAFGLAGRHVAREYLEKRLRGEDDKDDIQHL